MTAQEVNEEIKSILSSVKTTTAPSVKVDWVATWKNQQRQQTIDYWKRLV